MTHPGGVAEGAELAKGYISLSVKYGSAMSQIDRDLDSLEAKGRNAGERAGKATGQALGSATEGEFAKSAERAGNIFTNTLSNAIHPARAFRNYGARILDEAGGDVEKAGGIMADRFTGGMLRASGRAGEVGSKIGQGLSTGFNAAVSGIGVAGAAGFEKMETKAKETTGEIGAGVMGLVSGPMLKLSLAVTTVAGAFELLKGGFERLETLQHTKEQLEAMGYSGQQISEVFKNVQDSVKGTQYGVEELAGVTKRALMQGIQPGQQMVEYLKDIQNAAALTDQPIEAVGTLLDRLRTKGSATNREMMRFTTMGLPMKTWIMKDLGLTEAAYDDFVKHHGVTYQLFMDELGKHTHEGAERMAESISGQTHKMGENLKAIGSDLVAPFFGSIPKGLQSINAKLEEFDGFLQAHAKSISSFVHGVFGPIGNLVSGVTKGIGAFASGTMQGVKDAHEGMGDGLGTAVTSFVNALRTAGDWLKQHTDQIRSWGDAFGHAIGNVQHAFHNVEHAGSNVEHALGNFGHAMGNVGHAFGNIGHAIGNVMHALENIGHAFGNIFHALGFDILAHLIGETLKSAFDTGIAIVLSTWHTIEGLWHAAEGAWHVTEDLWHAFTHLIDGPLHGFEDIITKDVKPALTDVGHFFRDLANDGVKVIEFFEHLPEKILNAFGDLGKDLGQAIKDALTHINLNPFRHADGAVRAYANGGLPSQAMIAAPRPGGLVQWAEPSTGGEAFIPLHPSKRARSLKLWKQTGHLLGVMGHEGVYGDKKWSGIHGSKFDDGGLTGPGLGIASPAFWERLKHFAPKLWEQLKSAATFMAQPTAFDDGGLTGPGLGIASPAFWGKLKQFAPKLWDKLRAAATFMAQPTAFDNGGITQSGVLQVIYANPATGQKTGEAGGDFVGPGTSQPGYYRDDWGGHTGHVHTSFATGPDGTPYGLPKGTDIRQGQSGFPSWVYALGSQFGLDASTYPGHQESSGKNRGIDWWPKGHADMSGSSYSDDERNRLQTFAQFVSTSGVFAKQGGTGTSAMATGNHPSESGGAGDSFFGNAPASGGSSHTGGGWFGSGGAGGSTGGSGVSAGDASPGGLGEGSGGSMGGSGSTPGAVSFSGGTPNAGDSKQQAAAAIVAEGRRRGYSDDQIKWILADSIGESGLSTTAKNGDHIGLFQQDSGYPGRGTLEGQVSGFYDRLDKTSPSMSIGDRISKTPAEGGVEGGGYGPDWISAHLNDAQGYMSGTGGYSELGGPMSPQDRKDRNAQKRIDRLNQRIENTEHELHELQTGEGRKGGKPGSTDQIEKAQQRLDNLRQDLKDAQDDQKSILASGGSKRGSGRDGGGGTDGLSGLSALFGGGGAGDEDSLKSLADIGTEGIMQSFLPPGFINPFSTTLMHAGSVIFSFLGALMSGKGSNMAGALMSGKGSNMVAAGMGGGRGISPGSAGVSGLANTANVPAWGTFSPSAAGAGGPTIDNSTHFEGSSFGYDHAAIKPIMDNAETAKNRSAGTIDSNRIWST